MQDKVVKSKPPRMVRKQILITPEQSRRLKARAEAAGGSEADIVRQAIARELGIDEPAGGDWKQRLLKLAGTLDEPGLEEAIKKNRQRWNARANDTRGKLQGLSRKC